MKNDPYYEEAMANATAHDTVGGLQFLYETHKITMGEYVGLLLEAHREIEKVLSDFGYPYGE